MWFLFLFVAYDFGGLVLLGRVDSVEFCLLWVCLGA